MQDANISPVGMIDRLLNSNLKNPHNLELLFQYARNEDNRLLIKYVRSIAAKNAKECLESTREKFLEIYKKSLLYAAKYDFDSYLIYLELERDPDKKFYEPRREQLKCVVQALQDMEDDKLDILSISLPPGTGKSTLGIFLCRGLQENILISLI